MMSESAQSQTYVIGVRRGGDDTTSNGSYMVKGSVSGGGQRFDGMSEYSGVYKNNYETSSMGSGMQKGMIMDDDSSTGGFGKK